MTPNCNICMEYCLTVLENLHYKNIKLTKRNQIYGSCRHKMTFRSFFLSTDNTVNGWKGSTINWILSLRILKRQQLVLVLGSFFLSLEKHLKITRYKKVKQNRLFVSYELILKFQVQCSLNGNMCIRLYI